MFPVSEANFFREKISDFRATAAIKQQRLLYRILGWAALVAAGGIGVCRYNANSGGGLGLSEEDKLRNSEVVEKLREMGGSRMIIGEILCLFLL